MKKPTHLILLILALSGLSLLGRAQTVSPVKFPTDADVILYVTDSLDADVIVYKVSTADSASGNSGLWYFTNFADQANKRIFFTHTASLAQLNIYFTKNPQGAGWINASKSSLMN